MQIYLEINSVQQGLKYKLFDEIHVLVAKQCYFIINALELCNICSKLMGLNTVHLQKTCTIFLYLILLYLYHCFQHINATYLTIYHSGLLCANLTIARVPINSLWPNDTRWHRRSWSSLVQIMACCLTAPSHYMNQCWFLISEVLWHSPESNLTVSSQDTALYHEFENNIFKIIATSTRGQWVK